MLHLSINVKKLGKEHLDLLTNDFLQCRIASWTALSALSLHHSMLTDALLVLDELVRLLDFFDELNRISFTLTYNGLRKLAYLCRNFFVDLLQILANDDLNFALFELSLFHVFELTEIGTLWDEFKMGEEFCDEDRMKLERSGLDESNESKGLWIDSIFCRPMRWSGRRKPLEKIWSANTTSGEWKHGLVKLKLAPFTKPSSSSMSNESRSGSMFSDDHRYEKFLL